MRLSLGALRATVGAGLGPEITHASHGPGAAAGLDAGLRPGGLGLSESEARGLGCSETEAVLCIVRHLMVCAWTLPHFPIAMRQLVQREVCVCARACVRVVCVYVCEIERRRVNRYVLTYIRTEVHTCTHARTHTHTHAHTHTHTSYVHYIHACTPTYMHIHRYCHTPGEYGRRHAAALFSRGWSVRMAR